MNILVKTERFVLREILLTDVDGLFELDSDPEVHRYLGNQPVHSKEQIIEVIHSIRQQYKDNGIGRWAIIDKHTHAFIGWCGLKLITEPTNGHHNYYDLGYRLIRKYWGQGIATETALECLHYAFTKLPTNEVYAMAECNNTGSNNVLKKVGCIHLENFELDGSLHHWYKIEKGDYLNL
jgi:ribosomal-protein-alanine N-acetyltransferase